jgi:hypothetical protein
MAVQNQQQGFHAPEGLFTYFCERLPSLLSFSAEYCSRIALANVKSGPAGGSYVLWNVHTTIFIYNAGLNERVSRKNATLLMLHAVPEPYDTPYLLSILLQYLFQDPIRRIELRQPVGAGTGTTASASPLPFGYITSISFTPDAADEYDLLVGMSNGEGDY